jgi:cbb3-type cytochrome oxidase cytochrome c subunit
VRPVVTDVGLGPVSVAGDYVHETPALLGFERLGADLMHFGSRATSAWALRQTLVDPQRRHPWSIMPSYDYLSDDELDALVRYLLSLR